MKEKKTSNKKAYLRDFKINDAGEYEYKGSVYVLDETTISVKQAKTKIGIYASIIFVCYVICGFLQADGLINSFYVTLPFVFGFFVDCVLSYKIVTFIFGRYPVRSYDYKKTIAKYDGYLIAVVIFAIATILGEAFYLIRHGIHLSLVQTIIFIICVICVILFSSACKNFLKQLHWQQK